MQNIAAENPDIDLDEDIRLHKTGWIVQRVGWILTAGIIILALMGFFGTGPVSINKEEIAGHHLQSPKYMRYEAEEELVFSIPDAKDTVTLTIPQTYFEYIELTAISPFPARTQLDHGAVTYYFAAENQAMIFCRIRAKKAGTVKASVRIDQTSFTINHLIYP